MRRLGDCGPPLPGAEKGGSESPQPRCWRSVAKQGREQQCGKVGRGGPLQRWKGFCTSTDQLSFSLFHTRGCEKSLPHSKCGNINTVGTDAYHAARAVQLENMQKSPAKTYNCTNLPGISTIIQTLLPGRRGEGELPQRGKRGRPGPRRPLRCLYSCIPDIATFLQRAFFHSVG